MITRPGHATLKVVHQPQVLRDALVLLPRSVQHPHRSLMLHHALAQLVKLHQRTVVHVLQKRLVVLVLTQVRQVHGRKVHRVFTQFNVLQVLVEEQATGEGERIGMEINRKQKI